MTYDNIFLADKRESPGVAPPPTGKVHRRESLEKRTFYPQPSKANTSKNKNENSSKPKTTVVEMEGDLARASASRKVA